MTVAYETQREQFEKISKMYRDHLELYRFFNHGSYAGATPFASDAASDAAYNSTSALERAMIFCRRVQNLTHVSPIMMHPALVDLRINRSPAQSESLYALIVFPTGPQRNRRCHSPDPFQHYRRHLSREYGDLRRGTARTGSTGTLPADRR